MIGARELSTLYQRAHDHMRNIDGLHPQEAFDELLKYLFFKQFNEETGPPVTTQRALHPNGSFGGADLLAAKKIRGLFRQYITQADSAPTRLWKDKQFHLSDTALMALHQLFDSVEFGQLGLDIRSAALKTFLTPELRRGLGIFFTPDEVAKMMVDVVQPSPGMRVYDPACGSGTFLIEVINYWAKSSSRKTRFEIWGSEINPRMLLLAELNLGHLSNVTFHRASLDALAPASPDSWAQPNSFDVIFTNPPFGVVVDSAQYAFERFATCRTESGFRDRQQSEVVFIEQCLRFLRPGGILAIVLPKSVITNGSLAIPRREIDKLGHVTTAVSLPAETFATAGTQTTTAVLFFRKFHERDSSRRAVTITVADVRNIGYDATGRTRSGNQLPLVGPGLRALEQSGREREGADAAFGRMLPPVPTRDTLSSLAVLMAGRSRDEKTIPLADLAQVICTGRTPARSAYTDAGVFILKVGNLTGQGINWVPRDRNFVSPDEAARRQKSRNLILQRHDILLTSSAHAPRYIAQKIDIFDEAPAFIGEQITFVGEVMLIRPQSDRVDPFLLLAFLRAPSTIEFLQAMVRGQTAHLMPQDVSKLEVPEALLEPNSTLLTVAQLLRQEATLALELNVASTEIGRLLAQAT